MRRMEKWQKCVKILESRENFQTWKITHYTYCLIYYITCLLPWTSKAGRMGDKDYEKILEKCLKEDSSDIDELEHYDSLWNHSDDSD